MRTRPEDSCQEARRGAPTDTTPARALTLSVPASRSVHKKCLWFKKEEEAEEEEEEDKEEEEEEGEESQMSSFSLYSNVRFQIHAVFTTVAFHVQGHIVPWQVVHVEFFCMWASMQCCEARYQLDFVSCFGNWRNTEY